MKKAPYIAFIVFLVIAALSEYSDYSERSGRLAKAPVEAASSCTGEGITVRNLDIVDLWYRSNTGECRKLRRNYMFTVLPGHVVDIFTDLDCKTPYCDVTPTFDDYLSHDTNQDCRVKIIPRCSLADM